MAHILSPEPAVSGVSENEAILVAVQTLCNIALKMLQKYVSSFVQNGISSLDPSIGPTKNFSSPKKILEKVDMALCSMVSQIQTALSKYIFFILRI
jgi:predicted transcriptional regulator